MNFKRYIYIYETNIQTNVVKVQQNKKLTRDESGKTDFRTPEKIKKHFFCRVVTAVDSRRSLSRSTLPPSVSFSASSSKIGMQLSSSTAVKHLKNRRRLLLLTPVSTTMEGLSVISDRLFQFRVPLKIKL